MTYLFFIMENKEPQPLTVTERLITIVKAWDITLDAFMEEIGITPDTQNLVLDAIRSNEMGTRLTGMICQRYTELNYIWVLTGMGQIFNPEMTREEPERPPYAN